MVKACNRCSQDKPESDFYSKNGKPQSWCKECYRAWHRARYTPKTGADDSPRDCSWCGESYRPKTRRPSKFCSAECKAAERKASGAERDGHLLRKFGITQADYMAMLSAQGGGCAICGVAPEAQAARYKTYLHVDHCHDTGRVRGLLCGEHNLLIGRFGDEPVLLRKAADYLAPPT